MATGKKHWVPVLAPTMFKNEHLGDSYVLETETLEGRGITVNLMNIVGDMKKQNVNVAFRITGVTNGKAATRTTSLAMQAGSVKRLVRRGRTKISESFIVNLKHGQKARIKPLLITKNIANNSTAAALRHALRELVTSLVSEMTFETLVRDIVEMKLQRHVRNQLDKVYPLRSVDIREFTLEPKYALEDEHEVEESSYGEQQVYEEPAVADRG